MRLEKQHEPAIQTRLFQLTFEAVRLRGTMLVHMPNTSKPMSYGPLQQPLADKDMLGPLFYAQLLVGSLTTLCLS